MLFFLLINVQMPTIVELSMKKVFITSGPGVEQSRIIAKAEDYILQQNLNGSNLWNHENMFETLVVRANEC